MRSIEGKRFAAAGLAAAAILAGCKSIEGNSPALIPNKALVISRSLSLPMDTLALAAGAIAVVDPMAPNWRIEQQELGADRYAFALTKKRFATGGDGEAMQVFKRRVDQLASEKGYASFRLLEYTESIESNVPIAQRVTRGVVQFARAR